MSHKSASIGHDNLLLSRLLEISDVSEQLRYFAQSLSSKFNCGPVGLSLFEDNGNIVRTFVLDKDQNHLHHFSIALIEDYERSDFAVLTQRKFLSAENIPPTNRLLNSLSQRFRPTNNCVIFSLNTGNEFLGILWVEFNIKPSPDLNVTWLAFSAELTTLRSTLTKSRHREQPGGSSRKTTALGEDISSELLSFANQLTNVQSVTDVMEVVKKLTLLGQCKAVTIQVISEDEAHHRQFLRWPLEDTIPDLLPVNDGFFNQMMSANNPLQFWDNQENTLNGLLPNYLQFSFPVEWIVAFPLRQGNMPFGGLFFLSDHRDAVQAKVLRLFQGVSYQISIVLNHLLVKSRIEQKEEERKMLVSFSTELARIQNKDELLQIIDSTLKPIFKFKGFAIGLISDNGHHHNGFLFNCDDLDIASISFDSAASLKYDVNDGLFSKLLSKEEPSLIVIDELKEQPPYVRFWKSIHVESFVSIPLRVATRTLGILYLNFGYVITEIPYRSILMGIGNQLAMCVSNIVSIEKIAWQLEEIDKYRDQLDGEKVSLQSEAISQYEFNEIIGDAPVMQKVFKLVTQVSATESTALILGETGTGKELIARAIHNRSPRKNNLMVKLNCSAIPANLIESELFGHERGSFTGAIERRIGKFELANNGTLFLDEIGEMPLDMQVKLLRALQEKEIERIGGKSTIKVNVRIIAATNRNLAQEVAEGRFRMDLYYRLNVFPIMLPPLRERTHDIPALITYFIDKLSKKLGKNVTKISERAMTTLTQYSWPGNVRELEHLLERCILIANGNTIYDVPLVLNFATDEKAATETERFKTLEQAEKDYIIQTLNRCNGKVYGPGGAAELLGLKRSTLISKMVKLGIVKKKTSYT